MIDWCIHCADAGCITTKHKDRLHRLFAYVFVRIMKDALIENDEEFFFEKFDDKKESDKQITYVLKSRFYNLFIYDEPIGMILGKLWFRKSCWSFMRHMITDSVTVVDLWNDYNFKVNIDKSGEIHFVFRLKKKLWKSQK